VEDDADDEDGTHEGLIPKADPSVGASDVVVGLLCIDVAVDMMPLNDSLLTTDDELLELLAVECESAFPRGILSSDDIPSLDANFLDKLWGDDAISKCEKVVLSLISPKAGLLLTPLSLSITRICTPDIVSPP
jgi:hypothetical protein